MLIDRGLHLGGDLIERLVPGDALPLAGAAFRALDAAHGVLHAVGVVEALGLGIALDADAPVVGVVALLHAGGGYANHLALAHDDLLGTATSAVALAGAQIALLPRRGGRCVG